MKLMKYSHFFIPLALMGCLEAEVHNIDMDIDGVEEDKQSVISDKSFMTDFTVIDNNELHSSY